MTPEYIEQHVLPVVDLSWCNDLEKIAILTAMYDYNGGDGILAFELFTWKMKEHRGPSPLRCPTPHVNYELSEYFMDYPFYYPIPDNTRFEHTWICAAHGKGKTTLLENFIHHDLEKVKEGNATVVVMDSQGRHELLERIERTYPCTIIDTHTPMNIFARPRTPKTRREAEIIYTAQLNLITYIFSAALTDGGNFTSKQRTLWIYMVQLVMEAEGTVADMLKLLTKNGKESYLDAIARLSPQAQLFYATQFDHKEQYKNTKEELHWRLDAILQQPSFARMFTQRRAIDFYSLLQKPQCILVDTDKALLGDQGTDIFGRFIIAMLLSVSQQRGNIPSHERLPTYVYIDEAHDYIANDDNVPRIIDQARKMRMAFTFSHQRERQIKNEDVLDALRHCGLRLSLDPENRNPDFDALPPFSFRVNNGYDIVSSPPVKRPEYKKPAIPANTVTPYIHHGEILGPPKTLIGPTWGEDDVDLG